MLIDASSSSSYSCQSFRLTFRHHIGAGLSRFIANLIIRWSSHETCQWRTSHNRVLLTNVTLIIVWMLPTQKVGSFPRLATSKSVVAKNSLNGWPIWLISLPPHRGWRALVSHATTRGSFPVDTRDQHSCFGVLQVFGLYLSTYVIVIISIDRCMAIVDPISKNRAPRRVRLMLLAAWVFSAAVSLPQVCY